MSEVRDKVWSRAQVELDSITEIGAMDSQRSRGSGVLFSGVHDKSNNGLILG